MNQMIERVDCRFRVRWQEWKSGVEEGEKVGENEPRWKGGWFVGWNEALRFYLPTSWPTSWPSLVPNWKSDQVQWMSPSFVLSAQLPHIVSSIIYVSVHFVHPTKINKLSWLKLTLRRFSAAAFQVWNELPTTLHIPASVNSLRLIWRHIFTI